MVVPPGPNERVAFRLGSHHRIAGDRELAVWCSSRPEYCALPRPGPIPGSLGRLQYTGRPREPAGYDCSATEWPPSESGSAQQLRLCPGRRLYQSVLYNVATGESTGATAGRKGARQQSGQELGRVPGRGPGRADWLRPGQGGPSPVATRQVGVLTASDTPGPVATLLSPPQWQDSDRRLGLRARWAGPACTW